MSFFRSNVARFKIVLFALIAFSVVILIGDCLVFINYELKLKYEFDPIATVANNITQRESEIRGVIFLSKILFVYSTCILIFLINVWNKKKS